MIAWMYAHGLGLRQDLAQSLKWNRAAAQQSYPLALNNLGYLYEQGLGVPRDVAQAATFYRRAAELGLPEAQHNLAVLRSQGKGLPESGEDEARWPAEGPGRGPGNHSETVQSGGEIPMGSSREVGAFGNERP